MFLVTLQGIEVGNVVDNLKSGEGEIFTAMQEEFKRLVGEESFAAFRKEAREVLKGEKPFTPAQVEEFVEGEGLQRFKNKLREVFTDEILTNLQEAMEKAVPDLFQQLKEQETGVEVPEEGMEEEQETGVEVPEEVKKEERIQFLTA